MLTMRNIYKTVLHVKVAPFFNHNIIDYNKIIIQLTSLFNVDWKYLCIFF